VVEPEERRPRRRWEDNIKINLREIGWSGTDWINLRTEISGDSCEHGNEHLISTECWKIMLKMENQRSPKNGHYSIYLL
jgi:hypothetical protein